MGGAFDQVDSVRTEGECSTSTELLGAGKPHAGRLSKALGGRRVKEIVLLFSFPRA